MSSVIKITKDEAVLDKMFRKASVPVLSDFSDRLFKVKMLTGKFTWLNFLGDKKVFRTYKERRPLIGNNIFCSIAWGYFDVSVTICEFDNEDAVFLNYNQPGNNKRSKSIRDFVRCIEPNKLYLGRFYEGDPLVFCGYFTLTPLG